jgi:sugar phosphate isomerase/epimerase
MKLSCLPVSLYREIMSGEISIGEWAQMGSEFGLDAIDISILFLMDRNVSTAKSIRRQVESAGMQIAMLTTYSEFTNPDPERRKIEQRLAEQTIELSSEMGAQMIRITAGQNYPGIDRSLGIGWILDGVHFLARKADKMGVTLVFENHAKPRVWEYPDFSQSPEIFLEIVAGTLDINLGINFDTANATVYSNNPLDLLDKIIDRVLSLHASDTSKCEKLEHTLIGTGLTPFEKIFDRLIKEEWDGWICIEEGSLNGKSGIEAAVKYIKNGWETAIHSYSRLSHS